MKAKKILHRILSITAAFLLSLFVLFESALLIGASAETIVSNSSYTSPLSDLKKDEEFDETMYPAKEDDFSLSVIQIAESTNGELFLYVYQPSHDTLDLVATRISLYLGESTNGNDFTPSLYFVKLASTEGVFDKYVVQGVSVTQELYRYYNIVSIYREFNEFAGDRDIGIGNTAEVAYSVGQQWCAYSKDDIRRYEMNTFETVKLDVVANGYVTFEQGFSWGSLVGMSDDCDAHFLCFNFDEVNVEYIYDADLSYRVREKTRRVGIGHDGEWEYGEYSDPIKVTLKDTDVATFNDGAIKETTYKWNRIASSKNFVENFEAQNGSLNETDRETILSSQWVFAFCETENDFVSGTGLSVWYEYDVEDVAVLRIHFRNVSSKEYNLGVVANITDSAGVSSGTAKPKDDIPKWAYLVFIGLAVLAVIVVVVLLGVYAPPVLKILWAGVKLPFKIIGALFRGIGKLFRRKK